MVTASVSRPQSLTGYFLAPSFDEPRQTNRKRRVWTSEDHRRTSDHEDHDSISGGEVEKWTTLSRGEGLEGSQIFESIEHEAAKSKREKVLESFRGRVINVDSNIAYVELKNFDGEQFSGQYSATALDRQGVAVGDYFECRTVAVEGEVSVVIEKVERTRLPISEVDAITRDVAEAIQGLE